jgi:hypothetical protein
VSAETGGTVTGPGPRDAARAAELEALRRDFPRYGFETQVLGGQEHYTARRRPGEQHARPYSVTTADLARLRRELAGGLPSGVVRIHVIRDDNDGGRARADFGDVTAALGAVEAQMSLPGVYSIMITFDE